MEGKTKQEKLDKLKGVKFDAGMYDLAAKKNMPFSMWLEDYLVNEKGAMDPTYYYGKTNYEIHHERKQLKAAGKEVPMTAFEKLLEVHDIKAFGAHTDVVRKFFQAADITALWPEYLANRIYAAQIEAVPFAERFIANTVVIKGEKFDKLYLEDAAADRSLARTGRAAEFPRNRIQTAEYSVTMKKYGRILEFSYEAINDQPLNLFETVLRRIGQQLALDKFERLVYVLINGDGSMGGLQSAYTVTTEQTTLINSQDVINFASALTTAYQLNVFVGRAAQIRKYWKTMSDMTNPRDQKGEVGVPYPDGYRYDGTNLTSDFLLGVDSRFAADFVTTDTVLMQETQKVITSQVVETVVSMKGDYGIVDKYAIGALDINH